MNPSGWNRAKWNKANADLANNPFENIFNSGSGEKMTNWHAIKADLYETLEAWVAKQSQTKRWIDALFPEEGTEYMTNAAIAVLKAIEDSSKFTEGYHTD